MKLNKAKKEEVGKYLLDVSKIVFTVVVLGNIFSESGNATHVVGGGALAMLSCVIGISLVGNSTEENKSKKGGKKWNC